MIAEEFENIINNKPELSGKEGQTINLIINCIKKASKPFRIAATQQNLYLPLNENKLTQIYVEQIEVYVKPIDNIGVKNQYSDTFHGTKGIPDFYFHKVEEGVHHEPLMVVEAKILPAPRGEGREREYVKGKKKNGGIERFKIEKHGKGLNESGLLAILEKEDSIYWLNKINNWIKELATTDTNWKEDEILIEMDKDSDYSHLTSIAYRKFDKINLHHLWVNT